MKHTLGVYAALAVLFGNNVFADYSDSDRWLMNGLKSYTVTRQALSISDTPGSTTIVDHQLISELGISTIEDALAYVPGMTRLHKSDINGSIQYHGTNAYSPRRMRVLIDGRPMHSAHYAEINMALLPIDVNNIERIEVVRGPAGSTWGNNAFMGVINIISVHPEDSVGSAVKLRWDELEDSYAFVRQGGALGNGFYNLSFRQKSLKGFESNSLGDNRRDDDKVRGIDARTFHDISDSATLELQAGFSESEQEREYVHVTQRTWPDVEQADWYIAASMNANINQEHSLQIQVSSTNVKHRQEWISCAPTIVFAPTLGDLYEANPDYANAILSGQTPMGGSSEDDALALAAVEEISNIDPQAVTCGETNQNYDLNSHEIELQDIFSIDDSMSIMSGIGYRSIKSKSKTYFNGSRDQNAYRVFAHIVKRFGNQWTLNASGSWEYEDINGSEFSPKVAVNYHIDESHTLRMLLTKAVRTPDLREQTADWSYTLTDVDYDPFNNDNQVTFYPHDISTSNLESEYIISREIGYHGQWSEKGLTIDLKLFRDTLYNLLSDRGALGDFFLDNRSTTVLKGGEFQINYNPLLSLRLLATYTYTDNNSTHKNELTMSQRHSGTLSAVYRLSDDFSFSFSYLSHSELYGKPEERSTTNIPGLDATNGDSGASLETIRFSAAKHFQLNDTAIKIKIGATHDLNDHPYHYANNNYNDRTRFWLELGMSL